MSRISGRALRLLAVPAVLMSVSSAAATAPAVAAPPATAAARFTARLHATTHRPRANTKWRITITATRGRQKLSGTVRYRYLYNGVQVGSSRGGSFRHGVYHDTIIWPSRSIGHPLTFEAVVRTRYGTVDLRWWIRVRR
ncbi:MAG TPA: hypothetical protein VFN65_01460 [Solirubrobacteraceae bacterium]|nr:hypothetical protein [Solirubrobacteraceae bacterium]